MIGARSRLSRTLKRSRPNARKSKDKLAVARANRASAKKHFPVSIIGGEATPQNRDRNAKISTPQNSDYCVTTEIEGTSTFRVGRAKPTDRNPDWLKALEWSDDWDRFNDTAPEMGVAA